MGRCYVETLACLKMCLWRYVSIYELVSILLTVLLCLKISLVSGKHCLHVTQVFCLNSFFTPFDHFLLCFYICFLFSRVAPTQNAAVTLEVGTFGAALLINQITPLLLIVNSSHQFVNQQWKLKKKDKLVRAISRASLTVRFLRHEIEKD